MPEFAKLGNLVDLIDNAGSELIKVHELGANSEENRESRPITRLDVQVGIGGGTDSEYSKYLGRFYMKAGFSGGEACHWIDMLVHGENVQLPYFVVPLRGGSVSWVKSVAERFELSPSHVFSVCLKSWGMGNRILDYARLLHSHTRHTHGQLNALREALAVELADILVKLPELDKLLLVPDLDLKDDLGSFSPLASKREASLGKFEVLRVQPSVSGKLAKDFCSAGGWTVRGVRLTGEKVIQTSRVFIDHGILKDGTTLESSLASGVGQALTLLKQIENNLIEAAQAIPRLARISKIYVAHLQNLTEIVTS